jgi:hypothetical protein
VSNGNASSSSDFLNFLKLTEGSPRGEAIGLTIAFFNFTCRRSDLADTKLNNIEAETIPIVAPRIRSAELI